MFRLAGHGLQSAVRRPACASGLLRPLLGIQHSCSTSIFVKQLGIMHAQGEAGCWHLQPGVQLAHSRDCTWLVCNVLRCAAANCQLQDAAQRPANASSLLQAARGQSNSCRRMVLQELD